MIGRTMVRNIVAMCYFSFLAEVFLAVVLAVVFAADFLAAGAFFAAVLRAGFSPSATGARDWPIAPDSTRTTSLHRMWYVEASENGITCALGRLRQLRYTFLFTPSVRMRTFFPFTPSDSSNPSNCAVLGAS